MTVPPIGRVEVSVEDQEFLSFRHADRDAVHLEPDFAFQELAAVDAANTGAVAEFCREYGPLTAQGRDPCFYLPTRKYPEAYDSYVELSERTATDRGQHVVPVGVVSLHIRVLQALARHWIAHKDQHSKSPSEVIDAWEQTPLQPTSIDTAWVMFGWHVDLALQDFSPKIWSPDLDSPEPGSVPNLYIGAVAQLFNHVVEESDLAICGSETCDNLFSRQRGRSESDQRRSKGVKYCSVQCARAQSQRQYRRRQRAQQHEELT